jgi:deoxycytidine triphosphate deaminase
VSILRPKNSALAECALAQSRRGRNSCEPAPARSGSLRSYHPTSRYVWVKRRAGSSRKLRSLSTKAPSASHRSVLGIKIGGRRVTTLTRGPECWYSDHVRETGQAKRILKAGESVVIPPKLIGFATTAEILRLPFYLVSRFNLKLRLLYEGRLVGAGPQVDPGYVVCLVNCTTSQARVRLTCSEVFAVIEFQKHDAICAGRFVTSRDKRASE